MKNTIPNIFINFFLLFVNFPILKDLPSLRLGIVFFTYFNFAYH